MPRAIAPIPLWPLPLAISVTLVVAAHLAWGLSVRAGHVPYCIPYLEGCTSISRAARHGLGNHVFRLLVLPCSVLVGLHWWLCARRLHASGAGSRAMLVSGCVAAVALAVYAAFLGTEGEAYRFLRRYGVVVFFGCSYLAQLLLLQAMRPGDAAGRHTRAAMSAICVAMLTLGIVHVVAAATIGGTPLQDRIENALEWQLGLLLAAWYVVHAFAWRADGYALSVARPSRQP